MSQVKDLDFNEKNFCSFWPPFWPPAELSHGEDFLVVFFWWDEDDWLIKSPHRSCNTWVTCGTGVFDIIHFQLGEE